MIDFIRIIYHLALFKPKKLYQLLRSWKKHGKNLFSLAKTCGNTTLRTENNTYTLFEICDKSFALAQHFSNTYNIKENDKVAIISQNSIDTVITLLALSRLGTHIHCLSPELKRLQVQQLNDKQRYNLIIQNSNDLYPKTPTYNITSDTPKVTSTTTRGKLKPCNKGSIVTLTSGTTGIPMSIQRKYTFLSYLPTLDCLVQRIKIQERNNIYIPIPITQAFGLASLITSICFEKNITISQGLITNLIQKHNIESLITVPSLLKTLNQKKTQSLKCIISGGSYLSPSLIRETITKQGKIIHNLYGTNEIGFSIYASPTDMMLQPETIGKPLRSIKVKVDSENKLYIKNPASFSKEWINSGDKALIKSDKSVQLLGRSDDIVVSGGINLSPRELESILLTNLHITYACAYTIEDERFDYRLNVRCITTLNKKEVEDWLEVNCPRHLKPKNIFIV